MQRWPSHGGAGTLTKELVPFGWGRGCGVGCGTFFGCWLLVAVDADDNVSIAIHKQKLVWCADV